MTTTILVPTSGGSASDGAVELACRLAKRFDAHLEGFHVVPDLRDFIVAAGFDMPVNADLVDRFVEDGKAIAAKAKAGFEKTVVRHGLSVGRPAGRNTPSATWRQETGDAPTSVAERARFFDLVVLGRSDRVIDQPHSDTVEQVLIRSGRPVLLAPAKAPESIGEVIAIGWNGSPAAVHVVALSLPMLQAARSAVVISVAKSGEETSDKSLLEYLSWHGVTAAHRSIWPVPGANPGGQILSAARDEAADLLLMGGYGHAPWREFLFGGATREIVGNSLLPILLSH